MSFLGDWTVGETRDFYFTTRRFTTGAPFALAGTPVISAYEDNGTTQITAGITLTADFDSVTGLNHVRVVASGANGFEAGKSYAFVITTGTVDSVSVVGEVVGQCTIERDASHTRIGAAGAGLTALASQASVNTIDDFLDTEIAAILALLDTEIAAILADTNELQTDWVNGGRLDLILDARASQTSVDTIDNFLDTEIAAILAAVDTEIASILADTGTDGVVLSSATANQIADALLDRASGVETSFTLRQAMRLILAASAGKLSGAATTTVSIRDVNDTANRIVATVDADGNRSAVTLTV